MILMSSNQTNINSNVVNLGELIERVTTLGVKYNPVRSEFTIPRLAELKASGETAVARVQTADNIYKNSITARALAFKDADGLVTRAISSFGISGASAQSIRQAESKVRTYRSIRTSEKPTDDEIAAAKAEGKELRVNVQHNATFDKKIENFADFIDFLANSPLYKPNETDINVEGLTAKLADLKNKNNLCLKTSAELDAVRLARDMVLFTDVTGLVDVAMGVKKYIKSAFGATSVQYKSVTGIHFRKIKKITDQSSQE
jgi:hypothetical protein